MRSTPLGLPTLDRFPQFSAFAPIYRTSAFQVMPKTAEIDQTWPFFPLPSSAVALLRLPATINKIRMFPRSFSSSDMPQTRDSALKTSGLAGVILVDDTVVVECKAGAYNPVYAAQCLTYLRLKKLKTGLVINFGLPKLVDGVERVSN